MTEPNFHLPIEGKSKEEILEFMEAAREKDVNWRHGRVFSLVFHAGEDVQELLKEAYTLYFSENGLNPMAFPSLRKFETEVVSMIAGLLGGDEHTVGNMTTGGTESILMAVKAARDWARAHKPGIHLPEMVLPASAHPAFEKAAHYFGVKAVRVPVRADFRVDVSAMRAAISPQTILLVGSAPSYPQGVVDPIASLGQIALEHGLLLHVDACVGGLMLPFVSRLGYPVPDFDFQTPGVTSISADLHKYGYAAKGASLILYRNSDLRQHQYFVYTDWSGGVYASPTMTGTRPGGAVAAAWAVLNYLGEAGYVAIAETVMQTVRQIQAGLAAIPEIKILGEPEMSVMAIGSGRINIYALGDELTLRGWHLDRQQFPPSLHLTVNYAHAQVVDEFLHDLAEAVTAVKKPALHRLKDSLMVGLAQAAVRLLPEQLVSRLAARSSSLLNFKGSAADERSAALYGLIGTLPNRGDLHALVLALLDKLTR
ncbi:MAG TPA: aspartate aminotransferase family protein [Anaerolineales bacterium]|nr:aspartate aminotransferase family protein [Anaerolineales bacterium]